MVQERGGRLQIIGQLSDVLKAKPMLVGTLVQDLQRCYLVLVLLDVIPEMIGRGPSLGRRIANSDDGVLADGIDELFVGAADADEGLPKRRVRREGLGGRIQQILLCLRNRRLRRIFESRHTLSLSYGRIGVRSLHEVRDKGL